MSDFSLIILSAGSSSRFKMGVKKQWLRIGCNPLWLHVVKQFESLNLFSKIIIAAHENEVGYMQNHTEHLVIAGGKSRQESLKNALSSVESEYVMVTDAARACISETLIDALVKNAKNSDCVVPFLPVYDTTVYQKETINRDDLMRIQTPQLSKTELLIKALQTDIEYTDDSSAIVANGGTRTFIRGEEDAHKLTTLTDIQKMPCFIKPSADYFVGTGFDVHPFEQGKPMALGGIIIEDLDYGFKAHSDGDVAIHALIDAILGAAGMDDIGTLFPDSDAAYKNIDSKELLQTCFDKITQFGFIINHVDLTIMAEQPKLSPHKLAMRRSIASILKLDPIHVNIKATTTEKLGFVGRKEGVAVQAAATLKYFDWTL